jgi:hypothetical protein
VLIALEHCFIISSFLSPRSRFVTKIRDGSPGSSENGCGHGGCGAFTGVAPFLLESVISSLLDTVLKENLLLLERLTKAEEVEQTN